MTNVTAPEPGHPHPGGDGALLEEWHFRLFQEQAVDGEPLVRNVEWTANTPLFRSSVSEFPYEATQTLSTGSDSRWESRKGSFEDCRPVEDTWILFDLQEPIAICMIRLINYWSDNDDCSFKTLRLEVSESLAGPFTTIETYTDIPRCSVAKSHDLVMPAVQRARFWRLFFLENYGGSYVGLYGIDFWEADAALRDEASPVMHAEAPPVADKIELVIQFLSGDLALQEQGFRLETSVLAVKQRIEEVHGIPTHHQRLLLHGSVLRDKQILGTLITPLEEPLEEIKLQLVVQQCGLPSSPGYVHPGGNAESLEEWQHRLHAERAVGSPLLRNLTWTANTPLFRSSIWDAKFEATQCLFTSSTSRWASRAGSFKDCLPVEDTWILFDLQRPRTISMIRVINYWSTSDNFSFKTLRLEVSESLTGPFTAIETYSDIPRCFIAKRHDLVVPGGHQSRFWRLFFLENYGGNCVGIYGIDFWAMDS